MRGMNQVDLARASGVAQNTISEIETGRREARPATLGKLARALGVDIADFFEEPTYAKKARSPLSAERAQNSNVSVKESRTQLTALTASAEMRPVKITLSIADIRDVIRRAREQGLSEEEELAELVALGKSA
jgi:transcriptional regulator with XRE-family HTH domain